MLSQWKQDVASAVADLLHVQDLRISEGDWHIENANENPDNTTRFMFLCRALDAVQRAVAGLKKEMGPQYRG